MPNYRRNYVAGGTYFFTVVTYRRRPLFVDDHPRNLLRSAIIEVGKKSPFSILAMVLLPDHLYAVLTLPDGDSDYSTRWRQIKEKFTRAYLASGAEEGITTKSRQRHGERAIWQRRFWEHTCTDQDDVNRCIDYTHWNPAKHQLVERVRDYPYSTFHRYVKQELLPIDWGSENPCPDYDEPEWE